MYARFDKINMRNIVLVEVIMCSFAERINPSLAPQEIQSSFSFSFAAFRIGNQFCGWFWYLGQMKIHLSRQICQDCPNQNSMIVRHPLKVLQWHGVPCQLNTGYFFSMKGIKSFSKSFSNVANACTFAVSKIFPLARSSFMALPLGITTIIGSILFICIQVVQNHLRFPPFSHSFSSPPIPCSKYKTGYFFFLEYPGGV